ncbi:MAG: hypothetical protein ABI376_11730 [Caulobacteraceae bacterium]
MNTATARLARARKTRRATFTAALGLVAAFLLVAGALDAEVKVLFWPRIAVVGGGRFVIPDPLLGYGPRPDARARVTWRRLGRTIYDARYAIDADGYRRTGVSAAPKAETTVFLGDSYTFGDGLNDADTLPQRFADVTGERVVNAAFSGYGPGQALRLIQSGRPARLFGDGRRRFVFAVSDLDLGRSDSRSLLHRVGTPHYELANGTARFIGPFHPGWRGTLVDFASRSAIVAGIRDLSLAAPSPGGAPLFGAMMSAARDAAAARHRAGFLVLLWDEPIWQDGGDPGKRRRRQAIVDGMAREMARRGVAFVRVSTLVPDYTAHMGAYVMGGSGHPSALLDRRLARGLATWLEQERGR